VSIFVAFFGKNYMPFVASLLPRVEETSGLSCLIK